MRRKRPCKEISDILEKASWQCHKDISRRIKSNPWNILIIEWGSLDTAAAIRFAVQSFVGINLPRESESGRVRVWRRDGRVQEEP